MEKIHAAVIIAALVCSALSGFLIMSLYIKRKQSPPEEKKRAREIKIARAKKNIFKQDSRKYEEVKRYLSETGANYIMKREIDPVEYYMARIIISVILMLLCIISGNIIYAPAGILIGFFILPAVLSLSNKSDNEAVMGDIKNIYDTLVIKIEGGMFFTNALADCYMAVSNKRLKEALKKLRMEIIVNNNIEQEIDRFNMQFKNQYIDTFCVIIRQALKSGQTVKVLSDMSNQMSDIRRALDEAEKARLERKVMMFEMLIYVLLIAVIIYYVFYLCQDVTGEFLL